MNDIKKIIAMHIYCPAPQELLEALNESEDFINIHFNVLEEEQPLEDELRDIFEYYLVSDYLGEKLKAINEPIMNLSTCSLWGRTCTGQAIEMDGTIQKAFSK